MNATPEDFQVLIELNQKLRRRVMPWVWAAIAVVLIARASGFLPGHWAIWLLVSAGLWAGSGAAITAYGGTQLPGIVRARKARESI